MSVVKRVGKYLSSMQFAILLLVILAAACTVASFVTQGQTYEWYARTYSERTAALILALHLDDAFHSWWFVLITAFLCLNLLLCNLIRIPSLVRRFRAERDPKRMLAALRGRMEREDPVQGEDEIFAAEDPAEVFRRMHFPRPAAGTTEDGREYLFGVKNRIGLWGAWICHLGIFLLILGFGLGQMTKREYTVFGVPGQTRPVGDTGLYLTIDDFQVALREDDTVDQYTADITVGDTDPAAGETGRRESARIRVNEPATLFGMKFYQNSTGWAADITVTEAGEPLQEEVLCAGEFLPVEDKPELVICLNAFYPDYVKDASGMPATASGQIRNPAYLYTVYYQGSILGMNVLMQDEELTIDDYRVTFSNPQSYTLIQVKKDSFTWLALAGGLVTMLGLILAFYLLPAGICALRSPEGQWMVMGESRKGGAIWKRQLRRAAGTREGGKR